MKGEILVEIRRWNMPRIRSEFNWMAFRGMAATIRREIAPSKWGSILWRIWFLAMQSDVAFAELYGGLFTTGWGIWFFMPWFDSLSPTISPVWRTMMSLMDNTGWAVLFFGVGTLQIAGLVCESYPVRRFASMAALLVWMFTAVCVAHDEWRAMACPTALMCAVGAGLGWIKIGQSMGLEDRTAKRGTLDSNGQHN